MILSKTGLTNKKLNNMTDINPSGFFSTIAIDLDLENNKYTIKNIIIRNNPHCPVSIQPISPSENETIKK